MKPHPKAESGLPTSAKGHAPGTTDPDLQADAPPSAPQSGTWETWGAAEDPAASCEGRDEAERSPSELRSSEIRYRRLFEAARDGILILNPYTRKITDANPFMSELLGYPREEFLGKELWEIGMLKDERANRETFQELQKNHFARYDDLPLQNKSGESRQVEFVSNVYEEDGRDVIQCNIRDITSRKRAEAEINTQLRELKRWRDATLGQAERMQCLKKEVNEMLQHSGEPPRYTDPRRETVERPMIGLEPAESETERLATLRSYEVLDTAPEKDFDDLVALAAYICGAPIALISLLDENRQWSKAAFGLDTIESSRGVSFCAHAVLQSNLFVVPDTALDARFADNPLVTDAPGIRFYAGAPLVAPDGNALGTLCVIDRKPRQLTVAQERALAVLGRYVIAQLELHRQTREMTRTNDALLGILEDQRQAESALRESEELNRGVLDSVLAQIAVLDREGNIIAVNESWCQFARENTGRHQELLARTDVGTNYLEVCQSSREEFSREATAAHDGLLAVLRGEKNDFMLEYPCHSRGQKRWFVLSVTPLHTKKGGAAVSHLDITERKQSEELIRLSNERFQVVARATNDAVWDWDLVNGSVWRHDGFQTLFGYHPDKIKPDIEFWHSRIHPDDLDRVKTGMKNVINSGEKHWSAEYRFRRKDGSFAEIFDRGFILHDEHGKAVRMIGAMMDITVRNEAKERLLNQARLLDLAQDAIMVFDLESKIEFWNRGAESIYGWTSAEALGKLAAELLFPSPESHDAARKSVLDGGEWSGELYQVRKGGVPVVVNARWTLLRDADGKPQSFLVINSDITEHKKLESQFLRAQRLESIGTLASGVAHDLNNILSPILMSAAMLREELPAKLRDDILTTIETSAQRGADIVKQVLTFARGAEGNRLLVQPTHLIKEITKIAQETFPKSIRVRARYPGGLWTVEGDPTQLHQVLLNLCVNARDAMPGGGELVVSAENLNVEEQFAAMMPGARAGPHVLIQVSDTGTGIPREILDQIFDPFFTTKETGKGTGLGLSTATGIIKSHGGFINVYSEVDRGTTFKVFLPAAASTELNEVVIKEETLPRGNDQLLLVVDDERNIREIARTILQNSGYRVIIAEDGIEALALFAKRMGEIDAVLTDVMMPLMDGVTLIRTLRKMKPGIRIIASTGRGDDMRMNELASLDLPECLAKPYNRKALLEAINEVLKENYEL